MSDSSKATLLLLAISQATHTNGLSVTIKEGSGRASVDLNTLLAAEPDTFKRFLPTVDVVALGKTEAKIQYYIEDGIVRSGRGVKPGLGWHRDGTIAKQSNAADNQLNPLAPQRVEENRWTMTVEPIQHDTDDFKVITKAFSKFRVDGERERKTERALMKRKADADGEKKRKADEDGEGNSKKSRPNSKASMSSSSITGDVECASARPVRSRQPVMKFTDYRQPFKSTFAAQAAAAAARTDGDADDEEEEFIEDDFYDSADSDDEEEEVSDYDSADSDDEEMDVGVPADVGKWQKICQPVFIFLVLISRFFHFFFLHPPSDLVFGV